MLTVSNINVYYGQSQILNDVSLKVPTGEAVCVMGRNGVGKTTLIKTIIGLLPTKTGTITYDDLDITSEPPHIRAQSGIGYVPQGRGIFPYLSVFENLMIGFEAVPGISQADIDMAIDDVLKICEVVQQARSVVGKNNNLLLVGRLFVNRHWYSWMSRQRVFNRILSNKSKK